MNQRALTRGKTDQNRIPIMLQQIMLVTRFLMMVATQVIGYLQK